MANRTRDCDEAFTAGRLRKAEQFLGSAEMIRESPATKPKSGTRW